MDYWIITLRGGIPSDRIVEALSSSFIVASQSSTATPLGIIELRYHMKPVPNNYFIFSSIFLSNLS